VNHLLAEAEEPIRQALERLIEKGEERHPFVVVDKVGRRSVFVQFARTRGTLHFDVPALRISLEEVTPETGAARAVEELTVLGVLPDERVLIHEEEDEAPWKGDVVLKRPRFA